VNLTSQFEELLETVYHFDMFTKESNLPVSADLRCYAVIADYVASNSSSTSGSGEGSVEVSLPIGYEGTALLVVIARVEPRTMSYAVYAFKHNSDGDPHPAGTYATLSPLNHTLRADLSSISDRILYGRVFTFSYSFDLTETDETLSTQYYSIPRLLEASPMILVATGFDTEASEYFAEWVAYPQIPLDFGSDFTGEYNLADSFSFRFLVTINSAVYECEVALGGS